MRTNVSISASTWKYSSVTEFFLSFFGIFLNTFFSIVDIELHWRFSCSNWFLYFWLLHFVNKNHWNTQQRNNLSVVKDSSLHVLKCFLSAPNTRDLDVFLRKQESGFGFRVLGGDGPDQPVSETVYGCLHGTSPCYCSNDSYSVIDFSLSFEVVQWWKNSSVQWLPFKIKTSFRLPGSCWV